MHTLVVLLGIHALLLGFAFAFAGWMSLISPDENESSELRAGVQSARQKSWLQGQLYVLRWQQQFGSTSRIVANWQARPLARRLIYVGAGFLGVAAAVGSGLGVFS
jgi:hypothetical protein